MPNDTPEGIGGSLSLAEAAAAYATPAKDEEAPEATSDSEQPTEDEAEFATDETDGEPAPDEDEGQAEDAPEPEPEAPAYVAPEAKVKLPDGSEATVDDLIKGNLRDRDYRQKTQALASERETFKAKASEIQQLEKTLAEDRDWTIQLIQSLMPQRPDPSMYTHDPIGFGEQDLAYRTRKEQLDYLVYQAQQTKQRSVADQQEAEKDLVAREWQATLEVMPELKEPKRLQSFVSDIQGELVKAGYTPAEIARVAHDHRQLPIIRDAIAYRKLQANKAKVAAKVEGRPPVQRGGTRPAPEAQRAKESRAAMDRLKSSGSLRDGVAALLALEKG
jgi:hypothetical protein